MIGGPFGAALAGAGGWSYRRPMADLLSQRYGDLLTGSYDCVDRIVLNAYYPLGHNPGGFRVWWRRWHDGGDDTLDDAHLMRLAGRVAPRVRAHASAAGIPVIDCKADERKHRIAEDYLATHTVATGVFLILVARAPATGWRVSRTSAGVIRNLEKTRQFVNHYSFHIMDPTWGHLTIKMSGHPPFGAQVILNGHEFVACTAHAAEIGFAKEGNCFTGIGEPGRLAQIAETLFQPGPAGRLGQAIDAWIYTASLRVLPPLSPPPCFVLGPGRGRAPPQPLPLLLCGVSGRVLPEPDLRLRAEDGTPVRRDHRPNPDQARPARGPHPVRSRTPTPPGRPGTLTPTRSADPPAAVEPDHPQNPLRAAHLEGLQQGRTGAAVRSDRAQHQCPAHRPRAGQVRRDHRPAGRYGRPVHHHARLHRHRVPARRHPRPAPHPQPDRRRPGRRHRHQQTQDPGHHGRGHRTRPRPQRVHRRRP